MKHCSTPYYGGLIPQLRCNHMYIHVYSLTVVRYMCYMARTWELVMSSTVCHACGLAVAIYTGTCTNTLSSEHTIHWRREGPHQYVQNMYMCIHYTCTCTVHVHMYINVHACTCTGTCVYIIHVHVHVHIVARLHTVM